MTKISPISDIIEDAKQGKMFILVDDENRENEGDLIIPAQNADANAINFMAKYGRGLICLSLQKDRVEQLGLPLMANNNESRNRTAFTVSIEAREGISTGISAHDRAHTIATAINSNNDSSQLVSPGHVFPLMAENGGVLVRAGHTEAGIDIAKLAGKNPAAVICEIMKDDGTMARLPDLLEFAAKHDLKVSTIEDLIEYRSKHDKLIENVHNQTVQTKNAGEFSMQIYVNKVEYTEHIALVKGNAAGKIDPSKPCLVRVHNHSILKDVIGDSSFGDNDALDNSLKAIQQAEQGVCLILRNPQKNALTSFLKPKVPNDKKQSDELRNYGIGAQILSDIGVKDMVLLSNSKKQIVGLEGYGLKITDYQEI